MVSKHLYYIIYLCTVLLSAVDGIADLIILKSLGYI